MEQNLKATFTQNVRDTPPHMVNNQGGDGRSGNNQDYRQDNYNNQNRQGNWGNSYNNNGYGNNYNRADDRRCFFCLGDHLIRDCNTKNEYIDTGKIIIENGTIKLGNGAPLPPFPGWKSKKDRIDEYYAKNGGNKPPVMQAYNHYSYGNYQQNELAGDSVENVYDSRDDEIRSMRVQRAMQQGNIPIEQPKPNSQNPGIQNFVQLPNANMLPAGFDMNQLVQIIDQLVQTRTGAQSDPAAKTNF